VDASLGERRHDDDGDKSYPGQISIIISNHAVTCGDGVGVFFAQTVFQNEILVGFTLGDTTATSVVTPGVYRCDR
jgi:hypothetical protein